MMRDYRKPINDLQISLGLDLIVYMNKRYLICMLFWFVFPGIGVCQYGLLELQITSSENLIHSVYTIVKIDDKISANKKGDIITSYLTQLDHSSTITFYNTYLEIDYPSCATVKDKMICMQSERKVDDVSALKRVRFIHLNELKNCMVASKLNIDEIVKLNTKPLFQKGGKMSPQSSDHLFAVNYNDEIDDEEIESMLENIIEDLSQATINCSKQEALDIRSELIKKLRSQWSPKKLIWLVLERNHT